MVFMFLRYKKKGGGKGGIKDNFIKLALILLAMQISLTLMSVWEADGWKKLTATVFLFSLLLFTCISQACSSRVTVHGWKALLLASQSDPNPVLTLTLTLHWLRYLIYKSTWHCARPLHHNTTTPKLTWQNPPTCQGSSDQHKYRDGDQQLVVFMILTHWYLRH